MERSLEPGEIGFVNLLVEVPKKKPILIKEVVYKYSNGTYKNIRELKKYKLKGPVKVLKVEILQSLGYENKNISK